MTVAAGVLPASNWRRLYNRPQPHTVEQGIPLVGQTGPISRDCIDHTGGRLIFVLTALTVGQYCNILSLSELVARPQPGSLNSD